MMLAVNIHTESNYSDHITRKIKSLSEKDVEILRKGEMILQKFCKKIKFSNKKYYINHVTHA